MNLEKCVLVGLDEVVGFHKLEKILTFDGKFNETVVNELYSNIPKNIAPMGNTFDGGHILEEGL